MSRQMIICRGFVVVVVVVVVCVTAKYSDHMCVGSSPRPLTLWRHLALPPATFLVFPGEHKLYAL